MWMIMKMRLKINFYIIEKYVLLTEQLLASTPIGTIGIIGAQILVMRCALSLKSSNHLLQNRIVRWIVEHTLLIFAIHRIMFIYILMPIREYFAARLNVPVENTVYELSIFIMLNLCASFWIYKAKVLYIIVGK